MRSRVRAGLRAAGLLAATSALCAAIVTPASAAPSADWQPDLASGEGAGAVVDGDQVRFDPATAHGAPTGDAESGTESSADPSAVVPTGLFTLQGRTLDRPTAEVSSTLDATVGPGSTATLDVRGKRAGGGWTEWIPSTPGAAPGSGVAELPEPVREVQGRIVLTSTGADRPSVRDVRLSAAPSTEDEDDARTEAAPLSYSVFATREGLVGGTTANGHRIADRDKFVALPSRRALSPNGRSDYSVKVCAPNRRCAFAPVWDIGPWNTKDDYWNPAPQRERFKDVPQGVPQAQAAFHNGHNGGKDGLGRRPANPAGIDLGDGIFWDVLGLKDNSQVQVDYLWTGNVRLSKVSTNGAPDTPLRAAPDADAEVVGIAADSADVPVQCRQGSSENGWVRVGNGQYLSATQVEGVADAPACGAGPATGTDPDTAAGTTAPGSTTEPGSRTTRPDAAPSDTVEPQAAATSRGAAPAAGRTPGTGPGTPPAPGQASATDPASPPAPASPTDPASATDPASPAAPAPAAPAETGTHQAAGTTGASTRARSGT